MAGLVLVTMLWGMGFVFSKMSLNAGISSAGLLFGRFGLAALCCVLLVLRSVRRNYEKGQWKAGIAIGVLLFAAFYVQTLGLERSSPSYSAFLTATYVVMVPIQWWAVTKKKPHNVLFVACFLSLAGAGILSINPAAAGGISFGDILTLISAVLFAAQIVATGILAKTMHVMVLLFFQMATAAALSFAAFLATGPNLSGFMQPQGMTAILYLGVLSTFVCYLLQTTAQRYVSSSKAGIIMACEALFGCLFSVLMGYDTLTLRMVLGGLLMFASVLLPELWLARHKAREPGLSPPEA